jgi:FKBP-type peptidyl-prolyl cis-trans isomerase
VCGRCHGRGRGGSALSSKNPSAQTARAPNNPPITSNPPHQHTQALVKEVIAKGKGAETPPPGAEVSAHYVGKLPSGADFDSRYVAYSSPPSRLFARLPEP